MPATEGTPGDGVKVLNKYIQLRPTHYNSKRNEKGERGQPAKDDVALKGRYEEMTGTPEDTSEGCGMTEKAGKEGEVARLERSERAEEDEDTDGGKIGIESTAKKEMGEEREDNNIVATSPRSMKRAPKSEPSQDFLQGLLTGATLQHRARKGLSGQDSRVHEDDS